MRDFFLVGLFLTGLAAVLYLVKLFIDNGIANAKTSATGTLETADGTGISVTLN